MGALYLDTEQISAFLEMVRERAELPFIYPMCVFVAHTGARRSEVMRSRIDDFDFRSRIVHIREKKKSRRKAMTYRRVPMTDLLSNVMTEWFAEHPGGQYTICFNDGTALEREQAQHHFRQTKTNTKWDRVRGFHVFRHSFASNLAAAGTDQRLIDDWMGHQTEEMRRRYRHLFPDQQHRAINTVFGGE